LLRRWNDKINLTSLPDGDEAVDRLLVEPILAARLMVEPASLVVDIGSGGGSPAIPLKIAAPIQALWMVESKARKSAFLREAVRQLSLAGARVESGRFEDLVLRPELFGQVDLITLRAVRADLKGLALIQQFLRPRGQIFYFTRIGAAQKLMLPPQLELSGEEALLPALQSSLVRLQKRDHSAYDAS
jgi:16S rRNA (guanine527-N7)-methyltransferase